ncbi:MAG TPA: hypothetical protein VGM93_08630, partial [Acidimicrobiales bacterium]
TAATNRPYLKVGRAMKVTFPDGSTGTALLTAVGQVTTEGPSGQGSVTATATLGDAKEAVAFPGGKVDVDVVVERHSDVLTVPVTALLALREGGYAVSVPGAAGSRLLPVKVGMIVNDTVEISGSGVAAGLKVEVPRA